MIILFFIIVLLLNILGEYLVGAILFFGFIYFIIFNFFKKVLSKNSKNLSESYEARTSLLNNSIGLFKLIKVNNLEKFFLKNFLKKIIELLNHKLLIQY